MRLTILVIGMLAASFFAASPALPPRANDAGGDQMTGAVCAPSPSSRIPLWLKILYTLFCAVLVPYYWKEYSPWNFLYFCDLALLITLPAIWLENRLLVSMQAVAILLPQLIWITDLAVATTGHRFIGITNYMFNPSLPLFTRLLSLFHLWLPILLIFLLSRLGYDGRALGWQIAAGLVVLLICYFLAPHSAPADRPNMAVNINYVLGPDSAHPQTWMSAGAYFAVCCVVLVAVVYLPTNLVLRWLFSATRIT